jgi:hypothetical protein
MPFIATTSSGEAPFLVRTAVSVGQALGRWRQRRIAAAQDAYIETWKAAWAHGCDAGWRQVPVEAVPHRNGPRRDAWLAGWRWASTHPDRRRPEGSLPVHGRRRVTDPGPHALRAAQGGAAGLTFFAITRYLWRRR